MVTLLLVVAATGSNAQVSVNVSIGTAPAWGPVGYASARYYYLPDVAMYYDVNTAEYIYINNGGWVRTAVVPVAYRNYNFYNGYKVVLNDYRGAAPYVYYKSHRVKYPRGYHPAYQRTIGVPPGHARRVAAYNRRPATVVVHNDVHHYHYDRHDHHDGHKKNHGHKGKSHGRH